MPFFRFTFRHRSKIRIFKRKKEDFQVSKRTIKWFTRNVTDFIEQAKVRPCATSIEPLWKLPMFILTSQVVENLSTVLATDYSQLTEPPGTRATPSDRAVPPFVKAQNAVASYIGNEFVSVPLPFPPACHQSIEMVNLTNSDDWFLSFFLSSSRLADTEN